MSGLPLLSAAYLVAAPPLTLAWDANLETDISGYKLSYGTASGIYPNVIDVGPITETSVTNLVEGTTYFFAVSAVNLAGVQSQYSAEISHYVRPLPPSSSSGWTLTYVDSEDRQGYQAKYAFDLDPTTFWHTEWRTNAPPPPHEIQINLGTEQSIVGFHYLPRQDAYSNGNVGQFEFYVSLDGLNWGSPVATGEFANTRDQKEIRFAATTARFIRLRGLTDANGGFYMNVAELGVIQDSQPLVRNFAPVSSPNSLTTPEDTALGLTLHGTDSEGDTLTFAIDRPPAQGSLSGTAPNLTYTPSANSNGLDSFTFVVRDGIATSAPATVSIAVTAVNDAPVALSKSVTIPESTTRTITIEGADGDGNPMNYTILSGPEHGILGGTAPNLIYQPAAGFNGNDKFSFRVNDGEINSAPATVSITVTPVNDVPLASSKSVTTDEDRPLPIILGGSDLDADHLTFSVVTAPTHGTISGVAPNLIYNPAFDFHGVDQFTFAVHDGTVISAPASVSIMVNAVNDAPVAVARSLTTSENSPLPFKLDGTDVEGSPVTFVVLGGPAKGTLRGTAPNLIYEPAFGFKGSDSISFQVSDGKLNSAAATIAITVLPRPPVPNVNVLSTAGWTLKHVDSVQFPDFLGAFAFDGDPTTCWKTLPVPASLAQPHEIQIDLGAVQSISGFQYLPHQDQHSLAQIRDYEFFISLDGTNWGSPVASGTFAFSMAEKQVNFAATSGRFVRLKALGSGDTSGICVAEFHILEGTDTSLSPLAYPQILTAAQDTSLVMTLSGSDPAGRSLTFSIVNGPLNGTLSGVAPNLSYLPRPGFTGSDEFTFRTNGGGVYSDTSTVLVKVTPAIIAPTNSAPIFPANFISFAANEDDNFSGQLAANDANPGDILNFQKIAGPVWLSVSADGKLSGTPLNSDVGTNSFTVSVTDPSNASATATLSITVSNTNDAPVFKISPLVYPAGFEKAPYRDSSLASTATDPDIGDTFSYSKVSGPAWLIIASSGSLSGTPLGGAAGLNLFTVRATDSAGAFTEIVLQIKINTSSLPLPWSLDRVGSANIAGAATYGNGVFTIAGAGVIADTADSGNFGWQTLSGDGSITARVSKLNNTGAGTRVGVMIRESLAANSRQIYLGVDGSGNYQWLRRVNTAGNIAKTTRPVTTPANSWVRLVRVGTVITAYQSVNGTTWIKIGKTTLTLPKTCYLGLWVSSGDKNLLNTSQFANVVVAP